MSKHFRLVILSLLWIVTGAAVPKESTFFIITMAGAGSQTDKAARYFAPLLEAYLRQPVSVINVPLGGGAVAMRHYKDLGQTCDAMLLGNGAMVTASLDKDAEFDPMTQFVPVHGMINMSVLNELANKPGPDEWSAFFVNQGTKVACRKNLERIINTSLNSQRGERYSQMAGGPVRFMAGGEQVGEFMRYHRELLSEDKRK